MPMNDDDFMSVFTGQAKVAKQNYPVIPVMGTDTSYMDAKEEKQKEMAQNNAIDFSFLDDDSLGLGEKLQKFWRVQTNTQTPDERLESAEKVGNALGLVPQTLVENDDLYKNALLTYQSQKNNAYLQGQDFAPKTVAELYPELDTEDTVATTLALRDYNNVLKTREAISQGVPTYALGTDDSLWGAYKAGAIEGANLPGYLFGKIADFATKAYDAGQALDKQSELMYRASIGEISDEEAEKEIKGLVNAGKELDTAMGDSYVAKIVGETISQLSMQKNMMLRGIEKIMAPIAPLAQPVLQATKTNLPQLATLGTASALGAVGATGAAAGATVAGAAALAGAVTLGTAAVFVGTYRAEAGQAYWDWRTKRNKNGQRTYTREQAIGHAKRVGVMNAAIEAGAWELAFKGIAKVYGKEAATAVIKDTEAMKKMIGAGRKAIKLQSLKYGTKQFAKVAIPETVEEGLQSLTADIDTNLFGEGGISKKEMFNNALDAMIQAVPSVIGMSAGGSLVGGVGAYRAMKKISGLSEVEEACMEFKRTNEKTMLEKIMELRKESSLFQKAPEAYRKTIQKQMDQSGMGTVYIDAQTAAENEATHEALNEMVEKGIVSAKELDESIKTGKPLTVESGKYLQLASETTPETLADYTTMDKGERTLHAIKEERERLKNLISLVTGTKEKREKAAAEKILNEHFSEDTEKGREDRATAQELLSGGLDNLQENYKSLLQEAKETWGKLSGVKELQDYMERRKTQDANISHEKGVDFVDTGEGPDRVHTRESKNPDWYQDFYGDNDRAPNQRELYDIAHEKTIRENDKGDDASKVGIQELEAAKAKVESLERVGEVIKALDKEDLVAQTLLDPDTYEEAYKPLLEQLGKGNVAVTKAARDSALVLAKLAENFHKNYGVPLKLATMEIMKENPFNEKGNFHQMAGEFAETAPLDKLKHAEQMEIEGTEPEEIWKQTGWVRGPEGLWRFEIPDNLDNMHLDKLSGGHAYLCEIYDNPKLYQAYPELRYTMIEAEDFNKLLEGKFADANGFADERTIVLNKEYMNHASDTEIKKTILHELQHVIQEVEEPGFSKGGNPSVAKSQIENTLHTLELEIKTIRESSEDKEKYLSAHEKLAKAFDEGDFKAAFAAMDEKKEAGTKLKIADKQYLDRRLEQIAYIKEALKGGDYVAYRRLGGEAEAFMVMDRANNNKGEFPNYDTGYGAPVANFGGISHSLMAAREMNDRADSLVAFKKLLYEDMKKSWAASSEKWTSQSGVTYNGERITHVIKKHHLTDEQLADIDKNINNLSNVGISKFNGQGQYGGVHIIALLNGDAGTYRINLNFSKNGTVQFETAFEGSAEAIKKSIEDHTSQVLPVKAVADSLGRASSMPITTIQKELGIVKEENTGYYQRSTEDTQDLVVTHNITTDKLKKSIQLGGLPMPSLGISKKGVKNDLEGFGEITLIGNKEMIDPEKSSDNDVFSRDAYTGRFPKLVYRNPKLASIKDWKDELEESFREVSKESALSYMLNQLSLANAGYMHDSVEHDLRWSNAMKYHFLTKVLGKKIDIPYFEMEANFADKELFKKNPDIYKGLLNSKGDYNKGKELSAKILNHDKAEIENTAFLSIKKKKEAELVEHFPDGKTISKEYFEKLQERAVAYEDIMAHGEKVVNWLSLETTIMNMMKEGENQELYKKYIDEKLDKTYGDPMLEIGNKKVALTLENVVSVMKKNRGKGTENDWYHGMGVLLGYLAHRFTSIKDIRSQKGKLATNDRTEEHYVKAQQLYDDLMKKIYAFNNNAYSDAEKAIVKVLTEISQKGKKAKVESILKKNGLPTDSQMEQLIQDFLKETKEVTTDYFEAKPARAVSFNEFSGAVVPKGTPKEMVDYLKEQGLTVETYDETVQGDQAKKTEELASALNVYFQKDNKYQGSYDPTSNVIEIFDGANQSTAIHEGAHMFFTSLEKLAEMPEEELLQAFNGDENAAKASRKKVLADLQTIRNWASFSEKHLEEYKGTSLEKEFNAHAEAIRRGDANAEEIWMQERFARGFEKYLMDGSAPTKELRGVFRRFKSWLTDIYKAAKNLGNVELAPEIKDVFDKMLATENEINAWAAQRKLESIDKAINVDKSELDNLKEWAENVKQKALEKAMSYYLHMVKEDAIEQFKNSISSEEVRKDFMQKLGEENELYKIEQIYNAPTFPTKKEREDFLKSNGIASEEELKKKLQDSGGTSEERWNKNISDMVQSYKDEALTPEAVQAMAEDILNSPEGLERKAKIETMLLEKKVTQYINLVTSMQLELKRSKNKAKTAWEIRKRLGLATEKETAELEKQSATIAKSEEKITKLEKQVKELREKLKATKETAETAKEENKSRKESAEILEGNLKAIQQELEKERAAHAKLQETNDDTNLTVAELSAKLKAIKEGWVESRTVMRVHMQLIKEDARNTLGEETLSHATSWRWWQGKASAAGTNVMKAAAKNDWNQAAYWKRVQYQDLIMAKQARANEDEIRHTLYGGGGKLTTAMLNENGMEKYGILGIINRIGRSENPVLMKDDARYFVQHLAYVLGMTKTDGRLPIDKNGMEREFSWKWLAIEMNPMIAMENPNYKAEDIIPDWIRAAFNGNQPMKMKDLTMNQFREMTKVIKAVYRLGRREYEGNTLGTSFDNASEEISNEIMNKWEKSGHRVTTPQIKVVTATEKDRKKTRFHDLVRSITLPEILIERMGKKAYQYIYQPIDKATARRRELKAEARKTFQENFKMYTVKEWAVMRNKRIYKYGIDENGKPAAWTKEEVLCMALNFGTQSNRDRLIESLWGNEKQLMNFLDSVLDDRDWTFVEKVWAHENSYWGARNKIQNDLYGVPLGKVKGLNFYNKDGRLIHGQYYRIKYDPKTSSKTGHLAKDDIARMDMENMSAFSLGMGSTKKRALTSGGQKLRFDLDVYTESVQEAIQHVAMREATVDVYKLLNQKDVIAAIETTMGVNTLGELQNWVKDNWHSSVRDMCEWDTFFAQCRRKFTFATMGFRFSTALLNLCNIFGMMERIGAGNALKAVGDFYFKGGMKEKWNFITTKSSMMKERAATMDRDTYIGDDMPVKRHESKLRSKIEHGKFGTDSINSKAYALIAYTDMLFSCPEWLHIYQRTMVELEQEGKLSREEMDQEAVRRADKAVRETFGSGETKDQTEFIRKNNALAQATAFFSYTNLVTNQFIRAGYIKYDTGNIKPLLKATWYWWILGSLLETVLRVWGDDSDDEDKWKNKFAHVLASSGPTGGIPAFRDAIPWAVDFFVAGKSPGDMAPNLSALDSFGYAQKTLTSLGKGDIVEAGRATSKLFTRTTIPIPDTLTDAFWNFIRLIGTDNKYTITDYLWKSLWDRPLKQETKKGKKKE